MTATTGSSGTSVYVIETSRDVYWSRRKMNTQYKHVTMKFRDEAKYKEMTEKAFNGLRSHTKKNVQEITQ